MQSLKKSGLLVTFVLVIPAILLAMACGPSAPSAPAAVPEASTTATTEEAQESLVSVRFSEGQLSPETIQVKHGDDVTLGLETDRPGSFHIHGYDLEQEARVGEVTEFQFVANATGRFRINFHGQAMTPMAMEEGESMEGSRDASGVSADQGSADHGAMEHGPMESAVPVSLDVTATVVDGGVHVAVQSEGWRWAPEEVNGANSDGAGHAHIYADGVKLSRMYGPYHYIPSLKAGSYDIRVSLNSNDHSELTWEGDLLEASTTVSISEMDVMGHHSNSPQAGSVADESPMSLDIKVHEDELGGYNLQVVPSEFEFSPAAGGMHEAGQGYAVLTINGEEFNRLYVPWLQVPAQGEGTHTFEVALFNNEGRPYHFNGEPVTASAQVHEMGENGETSTGASGDHHGGGAGHGGGKDHHGNDADSGATIEELEVGYLEVLP